MKKKGRGVGKPVHTCKEGFEKNGALCYPKCDEGYHGAGPECWEDCPKGFRDDGAFCHKPKSYSIGIAHKEPKEPLDEWYQMGKHWYRKCGENFHNVGGYVCSPNCPEDMHDMGVSCHKRSYSRGVGKSLGCNSEQQYQAGLCYK